MRHFPRPIHCLSVLMAVACTARGDTPPPVLLATSPRPDTIREHEVASGVRHRYLWFASAPWAVHVVEVDPRACGVEFRTAKAGNRLVGRATTSEMARRVGATLGRPVLAAVNADFFSFDPPGVPAGPQVSAGAIVKGQGPRRAADEDRRPEIQPVFGVTDGGEPFVTTVRLAGLVRAGAGREAPVRQVNDRPWGGEALSLFNHFVGSTTPADTGVVEVAVRRITTSRAVGDTLRGVVLAIDTSAAGVELPEDGVVFAGRGGGASYLRTFAAVGDTILWSLRFPAAPGRVVEMIGGFPRLLRGGEPVAEGGRQLRPPFSETRHPRSAIGERRDGTILIVTVDGRQPGYSAGMSLRELGELFGRLGVPEALNLDGGGSTTLLVDGRVVNRPSDEAGERAVANALLVLGPEPGRCGPAPP